MAYALPAPGVLHTRVHRPRWIPGLLVALLVAAVALLAPDLLGPVGALVLLGGATALGLLVGIGAWLRGARAELEVRRDGVWRLRGGRADGGPVGCATAVRMSVEVRPTGGTSGGSRHQTLHPVTLRLEPHAGAELPGEVEVLAAREETAARRSAEEIARHLGIPLEDAIGDEVRVCAPGSLDARYRPEPEGGDVGPPPPGIPVERDPQRPGVRLRGLLPPTQRPRLVGLAAMAVGTSVLPMGIVAATAEPFVAWLGAALFLGLDGLLVVAVVGMLRARERLDWEGDALVQELRWLGLRLSRESVSRHHIEDLRLQTTGPRRGLAVVGDERILRVGRGLDPAGLRWLRAWIDERLR